MLLHKLYKNYTKRYPRYYTMKSSITKYLTYFTLNKQFFIYSNKMTANLKILQSFFFYIFRKYQYNHNQQFKLNK